MTPNNREQWLEHLIDSVPDHLFVLDENGYYQESFGGKHYTHSFNTQSYVQQNIRDIFAEEKASELLQYLNQALVSPEPLIVRYNLQASDFLQISIADIESLEHPEENWFEAIIKPLPNTNHSTSLVIWSTRNVTKNHHLETKLRQLAETDELTGILNRRAFMQKLEQQLTSCMYSSGHLSCLMIDIDHFKEINDQVGHLSGDDVIAQVARICGQPLRSCDHVGRLGGEEFGILLAGKNAIQAYDMAEEIRLAIANTPCYVDGHAIFPTVSIGVAEFTPTITTSRQLLVQADQAMYYSKQTGRDQVTIYHNNLPDIKSATPLKANILKVS